MFRILSLLLLLVADLQEAKAPVPSDTDLKKAEGVIRQTLAKEYAGAGTRSGRRSLAAKLLEQSEGAKGNAEKYVLLRDALENAAGGMDFPSAFKTIDLMSKTFEISADEQTAAVVAKARKAQMTAEDATFLAESCLMRWESLMQIEKYEPANRWAKEAGEIARMGRDQMLAKTAGEMGSEAMDALKAMELAKAATDVGAVDPDSNLAVGTYLCFFRGDWERGLPLLASGSSPLLQDLARKESLAAKDPDAQADLSKSWALVAEKEKDPGAKRRFYGRSAHWREAALKGGAGLSKTKAQRKLLPSVLVQKAMYGPKGDVTKPLQDAVDANPGAPIMIDGYLGQDFRVTGGQNLVVEYSVDGQKRRDVFNPGEAVFLPPQLPNGTALPSASFRFSLVAAYYGSGAKMVDVTDAARRVYKDPFMPLSGAIAQADTTPFRTKCLVVIADLHGRRFVRVLKDGESSPTLMR